MDTRKHDRVAVNLGVELSCADQRSYLGTTMDLSPGGAFLLLADTTGLVGGEICLLKIAAPMGAAPIQIKVRVAHTSDSGTGVSFLGVDADGYKAFIELLVTNYPDPSLLQEILLKQPVKIIKHHSPSRHASNQGRQSQR